MRYYVNSVLTKTKSKNKFCLQLSDRTDYGRPREELNAVESPDDRSAMDHCPVFIVVSSSILFSPIHTSLFVTHCVVGIISH